MLAQIVLNAQFNGGGIDDSQAMLQNDEENKLEQWVGLQFQLERWG